VRSTIHRGGSNRSFSRAGFQDSSEADAGGVVVKGWEAAITAEREEVEIALVLVSLTTPTSQKRLVRDPA